MDSSRMAAAGGRMVFQLDEPFAEPAPLSVLERNHSCSDVLDNDLVRLANAMLPRLKQRGAEGKDLLTSSAGQRHGGPLLSVVRWMWPRWLIQPLFPRYGLFMLVTATK